MTASEARTLTLRPTRVEDMHLAAYDNTKLVAFNTCPTWGVLRYDMHKVMNQSSRAMALEAGTAMHEVFAFIRLHNCAMQQRALGNVHANDIYNNHGMLMYGPERWQHLLSVMSQSPDDGAIDVVKNAAITILETSGFYDDDRDKYRTLTNMGEAALAYVDRWNWSHRVWVRDPTDPYTDIGVEHPYDLVVSMMLDDGAKPLFRFTGKLDGIRWHDGKLTVEDNKTTSRLTDAWELQFETSHQMTGYMVAASHFTAQPIARAEVLGLQLPQPRGSQPGFVRVPIERQMHQFRTWRHWLTTTVEGYETYRNRPLDTPQYTHSCMRYFRPCSLIPFCVADPEEKEQILSEMETQEWSPLHKVGDTE